MKKILIIAFLLTTVSLSWAQTNSLYFAKNIFQSSELNPARQQQCRISIGFPVISATYINLQNRIFDYSDFFSIDTNNTSSQKFSLDINKLYNNLSENNYIFLNNKISLGNLGFWIHDFFISFDMNINNNLNTSIPKSLFALKDGNYFTDTSKYFSATNLAIDFNSYIEYAIGVSKEIIPGLTIGGKLKIYSGIANASISDLKLDWKVSTADTSNYAYTMNIAGKFRSSFGLAAQHDSAGNFNGIEPIISDNISKFTNDFSPNNIPLKDIFNKNNFGLGVDLGVIYKLNNLFEFSASVLDLGFISWKNYPLSLTVTDKQFVFSGLDIGKYLGTNSIFNIISDPNLSDSISQGLQNDMIDTLVSLIRPIDDTNKYTKPLNTKLHFAAAYSPNNWFSAGILYNGLFFNKKLISSYTLSTDLMFWKGWSFSINYTMFSNSYNNLGLGLSWKIWFFQSYVFLDNISIPTLAARYGMYPDKPYDQGVATKWVKSTRMLNLQFGLNFKFGCRQHKDYGLID